MGWGGKVYSNAGAIRVHLHAQLATFVDTSHVEHCSNSFSGGFGKTDQAGLEGHLGETLGAQVVPVPGISVLLSWHKIEAASGGGSVGCNEQLFPDRYRWIAQFVYLQFLQQTRCCRSCRCWVRTNARVFMTYVRAQPLTRAAALQCDPPRDTDSPFFPSSTFSPNRTLSPFHIPSRSRQSQHSP